tara:strand:- start:327 stop:737 length:411 start_codon:yes stop_codon:yes gene_type:complete
MPDSYKILAQILPANTSENLAYTVPVPAAATVASTTSSPFTVQVAPKAVSDNTYTVVSSIIICNLHSGAVTYDIRLKAASADGDNDKEMIFKTVSLANGKSHVLSLGMGLSSGNLIKVKSSVASKLSFTLMGIEVT